METVGTMCEGEWSSFGGMFSTDEANFMSQFIGNYSFPTDHSTSLEGSSAFWPTQEPVANAGGFDENLYYVQDNANSYSYSRDSSIFQSAMGEENYYIADNSFNPMGFYTGEEQNPSFMDIVIPDNPCWKDEMSSGSLGDSEGGSPQNVVSVPDPKPHLKRKSENAATGNDNCVPSENPKKKPRVSGSAAKSKKNPLSKKSQGTAESSKNEEGNSSDMNGQSSSSYTSEDDTIVPQESEATDTKCKTRAGRGSATDPQSIYARKRRERINERLRILQNLVPNGTKVDISTMLEEAVQYVKFLQVQIKLLSSDDLWMYAPLAYNGMDIGLDHKITLPR